MLFTCNCVTASPEKKEKNYAYSRTARFKYGTMHPGWTICQLRPRTVYGDFASPRLPWRVTTRPDADRLSRGELWRRKRTDPPDKCVWFTADGRLVFQKWLYYAIGAEQTDGGTDAKNNNGGEKRSGERAERSAPDSGAGALGFGVGVGRPGRSGTVGLMACTDFADRLAGFIVGRFAEGWSPIRRQART